MLMEAKVSGEESLPARQPHRDAYGCVQGVLHVAKRREEPPEPAAPETVTVGLLQHCSRCNAFHEEHI